MGEFAEQYALEYEGIDISYDGPKKPKPPKPPKRYGCSCGRAFIDQRALSQHQEWTGHNRSNRDKNSNANPGRLEVRDSRSTVGPD
jgi:hypothetical protein